MKERKGWRRREERSNHKGRPEADRDHARMGLPEPIERGKALLDASVTLRRRPGRGEGKGQKKGRQGGQAEIENARSKQEGGTRWFEDAMMKVSRKVGGPPSPNSRCLDFRTGCVRTGVEAEGGGRMRKWMMGWDGMGWDVTRDDDGRRLVGCGLYLPARLLWVVGCGTLP